MQLWGNNGVCVCCSRKTKKYRRRVGSIAPTLLATWCSPCSTRYSCTSSRVYSSTTSCAALPSTSTHFYWYKTLIGRCVQVLEKTWVSTSCEYFLCFGLIPSNSWEQIFSNHLAPWLYFFSKFYMILLSIIVFILKNSPYFPLQVCKLFSVL